jgi:heat shock protein HslJ
MKKHFFIAAITLLIFTSCKKNESEAIDTQNDSIVQQDTTSMAKDGIVTDSTTVDSSGVGLPNKMSTTTSTTTTDSSKGKFALSETKWKLVELNGKPVTNSTGKDYFINLDSKTGKFTAYAGCNSIGGVYVMKAETKLAFSKVFLTRMACPEMDIENKFTKMLEKVDNYMIESDGKVLHFHKAKMAALAKFEAVR